MAELSIDRSLDRRLAAHRTVAWQHGIIGGLVASVVMALVLMVAMAITGDGFFRPLELIGSIWYGAFTTGTTVILVGLVTHLAVAALFGAIWAYTFSYVKVEPLLSGLVFGALLWLVMQYVVLPLTSFMLGASTAFETFYFDGRIYKVFYNGEADGFRLWMVLSAYLVFGLSLGAFEQWADRRKERRISSR